jgi:hypothetical protein
MALLMFCWVTRLGGGGDCHRLATHGAIRRGQQAGPNVDATLGYQFAGGVYAAVDVVTLIPA